MSLFASYFYIISCLDFVSVVTTLWAGQPVRFPTEARNFCLFQSFQNDSEFHPASYSIGIGSAFVGGNAAEA